MSEINPKPIPLDYARPGVSDEVVSAPRAPVSTAASIGGLNCGTLRRDQADSVILHTEDRADMAFASRELEHAGIAFCVLIVEATATYYSASLELRVHKSDQEKARHVVLPLLARRLRAKRLHRKDGSFKTQTQGGTWPDPLDSNGGFLRGL